MRSRSRIIGIRTDVSGNYVIIRPDVTSIQKGHGRAALQSQSRVFVGSEPTRHDFVVVLTRVADTLRTHRLRHRVQIVFFDMEETGLQGSAFMAKSVDRTKVMSMVNIDIAGYGDTIMSGPTTGAGTAPLQQALARVCAARDYACLRLAAFPASDDRSFQAAGIPAISMAVLPALEAHQVWLLLNGGKESGLAAGFAPAILRTIHTPADTADKLTAEGMTLIYNAVLGLLLELDAR